MSEAAKDSSERQPFTCPECGRDDRPKLSRNMCARCYNKWLRANSPGFIEKQRENSRKWGLRNRDRIAEYCRRKRRDHPEEDVARTLKRRFGMTIADYNSILNAQDGKCAICGKLASSAKRRFALDHDHSTGKVRGLLCFRCNYGIGWFQEDPARLSRASEYLAVTMNWPWSARQKRESNSKDINIGFKKGDA